MPWVRGKKTPKNELLGTTVILLELQGMKALRLSEIPQKETFPVSES